MRTRLYTLLAASILLPSCTPHLYFPDPVNVPAFTEGHEIKATISAKLQGILGDVEDSHVSPSAYLAFARQSI